MWVAVVLVTVQVLTVISGYNIDALINVPITLFSTIRLF